jgi:hypothetical protein
MEYLSQGIGLQLNDTPMHTVSIPLAVKIYRTAKESGSDTHLEIAVVVFRITENTVAVVVMQGADQNTITVVKWHKKALCAVEKIRLSKKESASYATA